MTRPAAVGELAVKKISTVDKSHFGAGALDSGGKPLPQSELEEAFVAAFSNPLEGSVAFNKVKNNFISRLSDETQWVKGMNHIIQTWNGLQKQTEAEIRDVFGV
jgi:hypothetical protein